MSILNSLLMAQKIPQSPNKQDILGNKIGKWTVLCNSERTYTKDPKEATYYRIVSYKNAEPKGIVNLLYVGSIT